MSKALAPIASLLLGVGFVLAGAGLLATLVPLRAQSLGFSSLVVGGIGSAYYLGFVAGCLAGPHLIRRVGHIRTFATLMALASATALVHPVVPEAAAWIAARAITGFCLAGLYLVTESWLNDGASNDSRGLVMSAYIFVNFGSITLGQLMMTLASVDRFELFATVAMLISIGVVPVALTRSAQPAPIALVRFRPLRLFRIAPVGIAGSFMIGIANGAFWSLAPVFATGRGLSTNEAAVFLSVAVVGGALMQWPVGRLSDRFDRRVVLSVVTALAALFSLLLAFAPISGAALLVFGFTFGCATLTGYSIAAAHAYDRSDRSDYVEMATGVLLANGVGAIIGPMIAASAMQRWGGSMLFVHIAVVELLLIAFIAHRTFSRPAVAADAKAAFDIPSTAQVGGSIAHPDADRPEEAAPERRNVA